jgi:hypothetical protein
MPGERTAEVVFSFAQTMPTILMSTAFSYTFCINASSPVISS